MKTKIFKLTSLALLLSTSSYVIADDDTDSVRLPMQSGMNQDLLLSGRLDQQQTIHIGKSLSDRINLEINLFTDSTETAPDNHGVFLDGRYNLTTSKTFTPFITGGFANLKNKYLDPEQPDTTANIGFGFEHTSKGNGARVKADIRYFTDDLQFSGQANTVEDDWALSIGVSIPFSLDTLK